MIALLRAELKSVPKYQKSQSWALRVDAMSPKQVIAVHISFRKRGLFNGNNKQQTTPRG